MADIKTLIHAVEMKLAKLDEAVGTRPDWRDFDAVSAWQTRQTQEFDRLKDELEELGARFSGSHSSDASVKLGGIRSTSTSGTHSALKNWLTAARKRLGKVA